jgi:hypothetical protein
MIMMNKKRNIIICVVVVSILVLIISGILISKYFKESKTTTNEVYGVVKQINNDSIVVEEKDSTNTKTYLIDGSNFNEGDLILIKIKDGKVESSKVVVEHYNELTTTKPIVIVNENTTETTTTTVSSRVTTKTNRPNTTQVTNKDETILSYFNEKLESTKKPNISKDTFKNGFISIVDFIFYDQPIKGVTFKELKSKTKAKVIYYALLIDAAIDSKFPNYKENISSKYSDIKAKLVAEFLELKYNMCEKSEDGCKQASDDFELLKYSLNLTWDTVKSFFKYIKDLSVPKIQSWYESFRG